MPFLKKDTPKSCVSLLRCEQKINDIYVLASVILPPSQNPNQQPTTLSTQPKPAHRAFAQRPGFTRLAPVQWSFASRDNQPQDTVMDELTTEQRNAFRTQLQALLLELQTLLVQSAQGAAPVDLEEAIGRLSRMEAIQQQKMAQATQGRQKLRLQQVQAALRRTETGDFGYCVRCDEAIGLKRLHAKPEAPFCIACQSATEHRR